MVTEYTFTNQQNNPFERTIQINETDYVFQFQNITMEKNTDEKIDYWQCKISDSQGNVLSNKPVIYNSPIFKHNRPSSLSGNFIFVQNGTTKPEPAGEDFANDNTRLIYYEDSEI